MEWRPILPDGYYVVHRKLAQCLILVQQDQLFILQEWSIVQLLADQDKKIQSKLMERTNNFLYLSIPLLRRKYVWWYICVFIIYVMSGSGRENKSYTIGICASTNTNSWKRTFLLKSNNGLCDIYDVHIYMYLYILILYIISIIINTNKRSYKIHSKCGNSSSSSIILHGIGNISEIIFY